MWRARIIEDGFALPAGTTDQTVTRDGKFRLQNVAGLDRQLQYFIVQLAPQDEATTRDALVVCAYHPALSDEELAPNVIAMTARYPAHVPVWIREDRTGWARLACSDADARELASAAVAIVKASAGWDESSPILVDVKAQRFAVTARFVDRAWRAEVQRVDLGDR